MMVDFVYDALIDISLERAMSACMPVVFVSHGAPDVLLNAPDTVDRWREITLRIPQPSAILVISVHWEGTRATASSSVLPDTIHDFSGFSEELYRIQYPAPGAPGLAVRVVKLLAGVNAGLDQGRGLDHGAWVPLSVMYPDANIPVMQLSLVAGGNAATHFEIGRMLAPLREQGVLIFASGAITHNFSWLDWHYTPDQAPLARAAQFADWVAEKLAAGDVPSLLDYRAAPRGADAHPSEEHFMPLLVALGAAGGDMPVRYQPKFTYGALAMDAYFWPA
jgi:4,5-DOPA dioxygenase extradiol